MSQIKSPFISIKQGIRTFYLTKLTAQTITSIAMLLYEINLQRKVQFNEYLIQDGYQALKNLR